MRQISALDAQFLHVENATTVGHVGAVVLLAAPRATRRGHPVPPRLTVESLRALIDPRLPLVPALRQRLVTVPFGLSRPVFVDDPGFDIEFHIREVSLPAPGDEDLLLEQLSRIHARPLDRGRPLWEMYLVDGLAGRRQAVYTKVHHAVIDGATGAEALATIMDVSPDALPPAPPAEHWDPDPLPESAEMFGRGVVSILQEPFDIARLIPQVGPHLAALPGLSRLPGIGLASAVASALTAATRTAVAPPTERILVSPPTPLNAAITAHRRLAVGSLPLDDVTRVRRAFDMTVNDVVLAVTATALRGWLLDHDGLPDVPVVAAVPVSTRAVAQSETDLEPNGGANRVSVMLVELATHIRDPRARLEAVRASVADAKEHFETVPATILEDVAAAVPTALAGLGLKAASQLAGRGAFPCNLIVSNVPGPRQPLYVGGHRVEHVFPLSAVTDFTGALGITVFSYAGHLDVGLVACRELVPDVARLVGSLAEALAELVALADETGLG